MDRHGYPTSGDCHHCHQPLSAASVAVWHRRVRGTGSRLVLWCADCATSPILDIDNIGKSYACPGRCGLRLAMPYREIDQWGERACSWRCRQRELRRERRRPLAVHEVGCAVCGRSFAAARATATTCSTRCRVARHRSRAV